MLYIVLILAGVVPPIDAVSAAVSEHVQEYSNLEFEYKVYGERGKPGTSEVVRRVNTKETLRLWRSSDLGDTRTRRVWIIREKAAAKQSTETADGFRLSSFASFDGSQTRLFRAAKGDRFWNEADVVSYDDTSYFEKNLFDCFLHLSTNGLPELSASPATPFRWTVTGRSKALGESALLIEGVFDKSPYDIKVVVTEPPSSMVISSRAIEKSTGKDVHQYLVESIGDFEGIRYPSKGKFVQPATNLVGYRSFDFSVKSVKRFDPALAEEFIPEFPPGTSVRDQINGHYLVDPEEGAYDEYKLQRGAAGVSRERN